MSPNKPIVIAAFYHFVRLEDHALIQPKLLDFCNHHAIKGTILLAREGINSTLAGTRANVDKFFVFLKSDSRFAPLQWKESYADFQPFLKMKVRLKEEIVRMGVDDLDISARGHYVPAKDWDALIAEEDVITIDTRNDYEVAIGQFKGAINPETKTFRQFPDWVKHNLNPKKHKRVAMYCTGGIRCEKSTALLKSLGFEDVYHLEGGILKYLEETGNRSGTWEGDCFVFDDRVAVNSELGTTGTLRCKGCGDPLTTDDVKLNAGKCQRCLAASAIG